MSESEKHILVACYFFPPYPSIGGRRTAKFCKALAEKGYILHVIGCENPYEKESVWTDDVQHENIRYYPLPLRYPKALLLPVNYQETGRSLISRIQYKVVATWYRMTQPRRIYDPTFLWEKQFREQAEKLLAQYPVRHLWVSVSPHYYAHFAANIKKAHPELYFLLDFRDPWLILRDFGLQEMNAQQQQYEEQVVREVVEQADAMVSPSDFVLDEFEPFRKASTLRKEIVHPYDPDDIEHHKKQVQERKDDTLRFIYGGALYSDIEPSLHKIAEALDEVQAQYPELYKRLRFDFFVNEKSYATILAAHQEIVQFYDPVGKEILSKVANSDFVIILYAEHNKNYRTTKFYENIPFGKPYFYVGPKGDTFEFIQHHGLGIAFGDNSPRSELVAFFEQSDTYRTEFKQGIDPAAFSLESQTQHLIELFGE